MYRKNNPNKQTTTLRENKSYEGETIETKILRLFQNGEAIGDSAPLIYTERKDGVQPEYNIRADRFDIAIDAMDKGSKSYRATREERHTKPTEAEPRTEVIPRPTQTDTDNK